MENKKIEVNDLDKYFIKQKLVPAIIQEEDTGRVLMLAYMNKESLVKTLETGYTWFYSRSRQELWNKGATSGHLQEVLSITAFMNAGAYGGEMKNVIKEVEFIFSDGKEIFNRTSEEPLEHLHPDTPRPRPRTEHSR